MALPPVAEELPRNDCGLELPSAQQISISIDLISIAKDFLSFLRTISGLPHLHGDSLAIQAIRRYLNYWIPLVAKCESLSEKTLVPPLDVQWVWLCHRLKPKKAYQCFCKTHYFKLFDAPLFLGLSSQDAARERTRQLWNESYSHEPFEIETLSKHGQSKRKSQASQLLRPSRVEEKELMESISCQIAFYNQVSQQYMHHDEFLTVAKERYLCFLYMLQKVEGSTACIPTCDIQLMWKCHQISPAAYAHDTQGFRGNLEDDNFVIQQQLSNCTLESFEKTSRTWELLFGHPYERAGAVWSQIGNVDQAAPLDSPSESIPITINWHHQSFDINSRHGFLQPRYVLEVCVHAKNAIRSENSQKRGHLFLRMQSIEACKNVKHRVSVESYRHDTVWHKLWCMQCEASTKGMVVDLVSKGTDCLLAPYFSKVLGQVTVSWKELEKELLLESEKLVKIKNTSHLSDTWVILTSITPPVQAPYLLKALLDRVTDDAGAMISKKVLRLNKQKPQEGRWMSRTVLNHAGRECFIIRMRVATGVWRSKTECPIGVDWNERIVHIHGGGWNYISGSTGIAPEEVLATATPLNDELEQYKMKWSFSTGETLTIQMPIENLEWERHLRFSLKGNRLGVIRLLNGRHMQYEVPSSVPEEEEGFVTLVRYTAEARQGRATALFNWKLLAMEVLPEEDVVLVLLLCIATQRAVADLGAKTLRNVYRRKHVKKIERQRNWGSVVMEGGQEVPSELMFWYVNPEEVLGVNLAEMDNEEVLPKGASEHMYRGTSWLYAGSMKGLYKMSSRGSCESFGYDIGDNHHSLVRFGSQTKVPASSR